MFVAEVREKVYIRDLPLSTMSLPLTGIQIHTHFKFFIHTTALTTFKLQEVVATEDCYLIVQEGGGKRWWEGGREGMRQTDRHAASLRLG